MWARFDWIPIMGPGKDFQVERPTREELIEKLITFTAGGIRAHSLRNAQP
jgi:hypothetical protein